MMTFQKPTWKSMRSPAIKLISVLHWLNHLLHDIMTSGPNGAAFMSVTMCCALFVKQLKGELAYMLIMCIPFLKFNA